MHPNAAFRSKDNEVAPLFVREISFAAIFANTPDGLRVAHAPIVLSDDATTLRFHLSRGNAMTKHLDGLPALAVVQGPEGYVSANWYADAAKSVPTWNYIAVEMEGTARKLEDTGLVAQLDALSAIHEARAGENPPWTREKMDQDFFRKLTGAITGFEMRITAWRPTFKLSQNRPDDERERLASGVEAAGNRALAHLMRELPHG